MANYTDLKNSIATIVKTNGNNEITGQLLQNTLFSMVDNLGTGYRYMGIAVPSTAPGLPDTRQFYIATQNGVYSGFNNYNLNNGIVIFANSGTNGAWAASKVDIPTTADVNQIKTDITGLRTDVNTNKANISNVQGNITSINGTISTIQTDVTNNKNKINNVSSDLGTVKTDVANVKKNVDTVTNGLNTVTTDLAATKTKLNTVEGNLNTTIADVNKAKTDITGLRTDVNTNKANISNVQGNITSIADKLVELNTNVNDNTDNIQTMSTDILDLEDKTLRLSADENVVNFYLGGYVTSQVGQAPITPADVNLHKYVKVPVKLGQKWVYYSAYANNINCFANSSDEKLTNFSVIAGRNEILIPVGIAWMYVTLEYSPANDITKKQGDYTKSYLALENVYTKDLDNKLIGLQQDIINTGASNYTNINNLNLPYKALPTMDLHNLPANVKKRFDMQFMGSIEQEFIADDRFNLPYLAVVANPTGDKQIYPLWRVYREDFAGFAFDEKIDITILTGGTYANSEGQEAPLQTYITVYYGLTQEEIENIVNYTQLNADNSLTYSIELNPKSPAIAKNPDKNFAATVGGNLGVANYVNVSIPLYPTIIGNNNAPVEFSGIVISTTDRGFGQTIPLELPITYDFWPVAVVNGKLSVDSALSYPQTILDKIANPLPTDYLLDTETNKIKEELLTPYDDSIDINIQTSDKIAIYGNSYTGSYYSLQFKSWINKLSNFLRLPLANFAVSGQRVADSALLLRQGINPYSPAVDIRTLNPSYVIISNSMLQGFEMLTQGTLQLYLDTILEFAENVKGLGAQLILGTDYALVNPSINAVLQEFAEKNGILYCPIGNVSQKILAQKYTGFWAGTHPGTRTNETVANEWLYMLRDLPVKQSVKIFRLRDAYNTPDILADDLMYDTIDERIKIWQEINVGEVALTETNNNWHYYDNLSDISKYKNTSMPNEYCTILSGNPVSFPDWALIEFISPVVNPDTTTITITGSQDLTFFIFEQLQPNYYDMSQNNGMFEVTEQIYNDFIDDPGTDYQSEATGEAILTYKGKFRGTLDFGGYYLNFSSPSAVTNSGAGLLTRVSNGGEIDYIKTEYNLARYTADFYENIGKPNGFTGIIDSTYNYTTNTHTIILKNDEYRVWRYDKLSLIITKNTAGNFNISGVNCNVKGGTPKFERVTKPKVKEAGEINLTPITGFGPANAYNGEWTKDEGILFEAISTVYRDYPLFNTFYTHVVLTRRAPDFANKISRVFNIDESRGFRTLIVKIAARMYPKIYNTGVNNEYLTTTRQINTTSDDYGNLILNVSYDNTPYAGAPLRTLVGVGWGEHQFNVIVPPFVKSVKLEVFRDPKDFDDVYTKASSWPLQVSDISVTLKSSI